MVLVISDPIGRARWEHHLKTRGREKTSPEQIEEIIRLSNEGKTIKEIRKEVHSSFSTVSYIRTNARRQGLM